MSRIVIAEDRCKGCGLCTPACPYDLVQISDRYNLKGYHPAEWVDPQALCTGCANCAVMCPDMVITVFRTSRHNGSGPSRTVVRSIQTCQREPHWDRPLNQ